MSNLINNSAEAIDDAGSIIVSTVKNAHNVEISVVDTGNGIAENILSKLGERGQTFGKKDGTGLGLYHARSTIESWGGKLNIDSKLGLGTKVTITLPEVAPPRWFVPFLKAEPKMQIVVLDDDTSIHKIWQGRFEPLNQTGRCVELFHLATPGTLVEWHANHAGNGKPKLYLVDYELLGFSETGLDLIEQLSIGSQSILVTSRYEDSTIRARCECLGVRLIPKGMAGFVPINSSLMVDHFDAALIDDDFLAVRGFNPHF